MGKEASRRRANRPRHPMRWWVTWRARGMWAGCLGGTQDLHHDPRKQERMHVWEGNE